MKTWTVAMGVGLMGAVVGCSSAPQDSSHTGVRDAGTGEGGRGLADAMAAKDVGRETSPCPGTCDAPPATVCLDSTTSRSYAAMGSCAAGACTYAVGPVADALTSSASESSVTLQPAVGVMVKV